MMVFLYGMHVVEGHEYTPQVRVPAETEPQAREIVQSTFGQFMKSETGEDVFRLDLLDVQEITDPELELTTIYVMTGDGQVWTRPIR
jgi:hypothetical protein